MDITWWVIIAATVLLIAYDIWTIAVRGVETSISWLVWSQCNKTIGWATLAFALGYLMGHLTWSQKISCDKLIPICEKTHICTRK